MSKILFDQCDYGSGLKPRVNTKVGPFKNVALVLCSAAGVAKYHGDRANSGIRVTIDDGFKAMAADSFEGESSNITFTAAVSTQRILLAGESVVITGALDPLGVTVHTGQGMQERLDLHVTCINVE